MNILNQKFDKIFCISLMERDDKYNFMKEQFEKFKIDVEFYRPVIPGYAPKFIDLYTKDRNDYNNNYILFNKHFPNELGAFQSHYHIIKSSLLEGIENLFVFEDDCLFHKDWNNLLPKYMNTIPDNADGVLLYSYMSSLSPENKRVKARWTKGSSSWSLLAYGLSKKAMEGYIKIQDENPMIADRASLVMMTYQNYNFYIATPPLVIPSKLLTSSIRGENKNYDKPQFLGGNVFLLGIDELQYE